MKKFVLLYVFTCLFSPLAHSDILSNNDIDLHIEKLQVLNPAFVALRVKLEANAESAKAMSQAKLNNGFQVIVGLGENANVNEYTDLETLVLENGYQSIDNWAEVNDRIETMYFTATNLADFSRFINGKKTGINAGTDIFSYIEDESNPEDVRNMLAGKLTEQCELHCADSSDLNSIGKRYSDLLTAYNDLRKSKRK